MDSLKSMNHCTMLLLMLLMVVSSQSIDCRRKCNKWSAAIIDCHNASLTEIPKGIPLNVSNINLSNNPLRLVNRSFFLKFKKLTTLLLNNVSLSGPIFLPKSLRNFGYSFNVIKIDSLKMMLSNLKSLERLELEWLNLTVTDILSICRRKNIKNLLLSGNRLATLGKNDLKYFKNLIQFQCKACSLKTIEQKAFDCVENITQIVLSNNELVHLPDGIFQSIKRLAILDMKDNKLEQFNASKLELQYVEDLQLDYNRIEKLDLQHSIILNIGLTNNRISRLDENSLGSKPLLLATNFARNRIKEISHKAFEQVKYISALNLEGNYIEHLPASLLSNTTVYALLLHNNSLSNVDDFILGMKRLPTTFTLYSNKELKYLNTSVFKGIEKHTSIFISCNYLKTITFSLKKKLLIHCYPSSEYIIKSPYRFLRYDGYECDWSSNSFQCKTCSLGFYVESDVRVGTYSNCSPCPAGSYYQDELGSIRCKTCPTGQFVSPSSSPGKDASDCQTCPLGTNTSELAGTRACRCLKGYYRRHRFEGCKRCRHAGFKCVRDYPQLKKGFWMTWNGIELSNRSCKQQFQSYILNLDTFDNNYDRNTMHFKCPLPIPIKCPMRDSCQGGIHSSCSSGYTGVLCGVCSEGYKRDFNTCVKCPQLYIIILRWIGLVMLFILLCYVVSDKNYDRPRVRWMSASDDESIRSGVDIFISSFKILIGFYQTLIGVMNAYNTINWPSNLVAIISMMEYIQFEIVRIPSLRCINPNWTMDAVKEFWLTFIIFLTFPILCFICFLVRTCCIYYYETSDFFIKRRRNLCARNCVRIASLFVFITYPLMSARVTYILPASCDVICTVSDDEVCKHSINFLRSDYSLNCPTMSTHKYTLVTAYSVFVILSGLPLALWIALRDSLRKDGDHVGARSNRQYVETLREDGVEEVHLNDVNEETNCIDPLIIDELSVDMPPVFKCALRFTYENYKAKFWYWEVIEMARKLIMTTGTALFLYHTKIGLSTMIIVGIAFAILHAIKKPMKDNFENLLQMLSLWIIPINLSAGAVIQSSISGRKGLKGHGPESWKVGMFLIFINSLLIVLIVGRFAKIGLEKIIARIV